MQDGNGEGARRIDHDEAVGLLDDPTPFHDAQSDNDSETWWRLRDGRFLRATGVDGHTYSLVDADEAEIILDGMIDEDLHRRLFLRL